MTRDAIKIAADKHLSRAHAYKLAGDREVARVHTQIAMNLTQAVALMEYVSC